MADERPVGWREVSLDTDLGLIASIVRAHEESVPGADPVTDESVVRDLAGTESEPSEYYVLSSDGQSTDVLVHLQFEYAASGMWIDIYAFPQVNVDVLRDVLTDALAYTRTRVPADQWFAKTGCYGADARAKEFYAACGFEFARTFLRMRIDFDGVRPVLLDLPTAVSVRDIDAHNLEGQRLVHMLREETFRDHWDHHDESFESWHARMTTMRDPKLTRRSWVLSVDGVPAAVAVADDSREESGYGYVGIVGVRREFRGRGLAKWLLQRAFLDAFDRGRVGAILNVDAESPTGADKLYRSVGMHVMTELHAWRRPLADAE